MRKATAPLARDGRGASIPLALDVAVKDGRVKRGDLVLLEAMAAGSPGGRHWCAGETLRGFYGFAPLTLTLTCEYR